MGDRGLPLTDLQEVKNSKDGAILTGIKIVQIDTCAPHLSIRLLIQWTPRN